jgi:hypothetical protein
MAVVQISKIQLRRGKKLTSGLPQLASGELAWAIDTQELYIGNGAVSEGAPAVGNTRVLTENDTILDLLEQYQYKLDDPGIQTGLDPNFPIRRTLQDRLDEGAVNAASYGISGLDDTVDQTSAIQNAITNLFANVIPAKRVTLEFDPGTYKITAPISLPSNVSIAGSGKEKTIFTFVRASTVSPATMFNFANPSSNNMLRDFQIATNSDNVTAFSLDNVTTSTFERIKLVGTNITGANLTGGIGVFMSATNEDSCSGNKFIDVHMEGFTHCVYSNTQARLNHFNNCVFTKSYRGASLGEGAGTDPGPQQNVISNSVFDTITSYGILVDKGTGNRSRGNTFVNVGGPVGSNTSGQIKFTVSGNSSLHDIFDRQASLERINTSLDYLPEVEGYGLRQEQAVNTVLLTSTNGVGALALRLPLNAASGFAIDYVFKSTAFTQMRQGTMYAAVDRANNTVQFTDEYEYTGTTNQDERLQFTASVFTQTSGTKELRINYVNLNVADTNTFTYTTRSIS